MEEDEGQNKKIRRVGFQFGYVKVNDENSQFQPITSWSLSPYCYVSDQDIAGVHSVAFICYTHQDQKKHKVMNDLNI